jgi:hypothetical protein
MILDKLKSGLALLSGWLAAVAIFLFWLFSRRRPIARPAVRVEPQKVPESDEEVIKAAENAGILKSSGSASMLGRR